MRCQFCAAPMPERGLVCGYCGQRNAMNLAAVSSSIVTDRDKSPEYNCPVCTTTFEQIDIGLHQRIVVHRCSDCDGIFITEIDLERILEHYIGEVRTIDPKLLRYILDHPRHEPELRFRYRKCPICATTMRRLNYRAVSGVVIDRCSQHGIWLDGGELQQLFEWRGVGGGAQKDARTIRTQQPKPPKTGGNYMYGKGETTKEKADPIENLLVWLFGI